MNPLLVIAAAFAAGWFGAAYRAVSAVARHARPDNRDIGAAVWEAVVPRPLLRLIDHFVIRQETPQ